MSTDEDVRGTRNWPELVSSVYQEIQSDDGSTTIRFSEMSVQVPSRTGEDADPAHWTVDGDLELNPQEE